MSDESDGKVEQRMDEVIVEKTIAGRTLTMKSGWVAKQADAAVWADATV